MLIPEPIQQKLDKLLGTTAHSYPAWVVRYNETDDSFFSQDIDCVAWHFPAKDLAYEQAQALYACFLRTLELVPRNPSLSASEYERQLQIVFFKESSHLDEETLRVANAIIGVWGLEHWEGHLVSRKRERLFKQARRLLADLPVKAYKNELICNGLTSTSFERIVVASVFDQFDILRIEGTSGNNLPWTNEEVIAKLRLIDESYGIDITGADDRAVEFVLKQIPRGKAARELGKWLYDLAPDIGEAPTSFRARRVALGWD